MTNPNFDTMFSRKSEALKLLGIRSKADDFKIFELIKNGLTPKQCERVRKSLRLSSTEISSILGISAKSLQNKPTGYNFSSSVSDSLFKLAELGAFGIDVWNGDSKIFSDWLHSELAPLKGKTPLQLMTNMYGMEVVFQLMGRVKHGVYS